MVKEQKLFLMEKSILGNLRMENFMVKEHTLGLMEVRILGNGRAMKCGTEQYTTKTETSLKRS